MRLGQLGLPAAGVFALGAVTTALISVSFSSLPAHAAYQKIRVETPIPDSVMEILNSTDVEVMGDDDGGVFLISREATTHWLLNEGVELEVVVGDLEAHYIGKMERSQLRGGGNFGPFHTYDETVAEIESLVAEFPHLVSDPVSIGTTHEGRDIWAYKVSDNPNEEENEPEVLFDGVHHAREIMTVEMNLAFSRYLCENYDSDDVVRTIVDARQVWFVPIVNPDGFVYNEEIAPGGGGLWRKNRRDNQGSTCTGVDPNRNYDFKWVGPGSDTDPCSDTYRGPSPGSEPCIAALTSFIDAHEFVTWQSYHSVAGMVLYPWGYTDDPTADDELFDAMATEMARDSGYEIGQPGEILYNVNGAAFDWGYGRTDLHPKLFGFTTEISGSGFWPDPSERDPLIQENLASNLFLCQTAGAWLDLVALEVDDSAGNGNGRLDPGESVSIVLSARNTGILVSAEGVTGILQCDDPYVELIDARSELGNIDPHQEKSSATDPFEIVLDPNMPEGRTVAFRVALSSNDGLTVPGTLDLVVGEFDFVTCLPFENPEHGWTTDPSHTAGSGEFERIEPNSTTFQPGEDTSATGTYAMVTGQNESLGSDDVDAGISAIRSGVYDLSDLEHVRLKMSYFHGQRDTGDDPEGDFFRIDASTDGGTSFPINFVLVGDQYSPGVWQTLQLDLEDQIELTDGFVVRVQASDGTLEGDIIEAGVDDFILFDMGDGNEAPVAPGLFFPADGEKIGASPTLMVDNATDPDGDALSYGFRIYSDPEMTQRVASVDGVAAGNGRTIWEVTPLLEDGVYYWRAFAEDDEVRGLYMDAGSFVLQLSIDVDEPVDLTQTRLLAGPVPSNGEVHIRYFTPNAPESRLDIFDSTGRRIRTLPGERWVEGWQETLWDGRDESGRQVNSGIYWVRLQLPHQQRTVRVVQIR